MTSVVWVKDQGAEYAQVRLGDGLLAATGVAVGARPVPYRLEYELTAGPRYVTRALRVRAQGEGWSRTLDLRRDAEGRWSCSAEAAGSLEGPDPGGDAAALDGALDCDLGLSPLTNTMPVLRHGMLTGGLPTGFVMAWVRVPYLAVTRHPQRYTPLEHGVVRYESDGFQADLSFGPDGLVTRYPGLAERVEGP
ncbi:putative glycolipid-binding domain-containing protein [Sphaerisporangium fuscum]|uniref:putative glycolipid-binding domain-containing protein n=1 Tax=Sphaerisporangium fuscum TaxID=2835868 RepID=UPI0027E35EED|nr:putative glycolipid-binding domain-containing protein [Sphaerisporangium fuscum]